MWKMFFLGINVEVDDFGVFGDKICIEDLNGVVCVGVGNF